MGSHTLFRSLVTSGNALLGAVGLIAACATDSSKSAGGACARGSSACMDASTGGSSNPSDGAPAPQVLRVGVTPTNLSSANDGSGVRIDLSGRADSLPDLAWLDAAIRLRNDTTTEMVEVASSLDASTYGETYTLTPATPLPQGWYTVEMDARDRAVTVGGQSPEAPAGSDELGAGKYRTHFRVGSEPHLLAVAACGSNDVKLYPKLLVTLSELVDVPTPPPVAAVVNGSPASLVVNSTPTKADPLLELRFEPAIPSDATIAVTISDGMTAKGGGDPVRHGGASGAREVMLPALRQGDVCRTWRETLLPP